MKSIKENFKDLNEQVKKVREWENKEFSEQFLVDAYLLAKAIMEKYDYDIIEIHNYGIGNKHYDISSKIWSELGIIVNVQENKESISYDYCRIVLGDNGQTYIDIQYYVDFVERSLALKGYKFDRTKYGVGHNNRLFYSYYALVSVIILEEPTDFKYKLEEPNDKVQDIIEKVTIFLLYLTYDYSYRTHSPFYKGGSLYLPTVHVPCYAMYEISSAASSGETHPCFASHNSIYFYGGLWHIDVDVTQKMSKLVKDLEKCEEYKLISQIKAPQWLYDRYKNVDYTTFGEPCDLG